MYPLSPKREVPAHIPRPDYALDEQGRILRLLDGLVRTLCMKTINFHFPHTGVPMTEIKRAGQPPRILNAEEIEKMRTACRVSLGSN